MPDRIPRPKAGIGNITAVLRHRNYRLLWSGNTISNTGDWMDLVALNWLVLEMTGSAVNLGLVNLARALPILALTLIGGVAADRFERRRLMMASQTAGLVLAALLAVLLALGVAGMGTILLIAAGRGAMIAFNQPARHSLVSEVVPKENLAGAIALNVLTFNATKIIGPLLAGMLIAWLGTTICFAVNAASFLPVLWCMWQMEFPPHQKRSGEPVLQSLAMGLRYITTNPQIRGVVLVAVIPVFFGQPYLNLLALFAVEVYRIGPDGLGALTATAAVGAIAGALLLALVPAMSRSGRIMVLVMLGFGLSICAFALMRDPVLAGLMLVLAGAGQILCNATNNIILQTIVPDEFRGRVLSVLLLNKGFVQLGTALVATLAALIGVQAAMALSGAVVAGAAVAILLVSPTIRRLRI